MDTNEQITKMAQALMGALMKERDEIGPFEASLVAEVGFRYAALSHDASGNSHLSSASKRVAEDAAWIESLSQPALANIFLNLPLTTNADPDGPLDKRLALEVAEAIGPDHAQKLYRFAVLVTKIA